MHREGIGWIFLAAALVLLPGVVRAEDELTQEQRDRIEHTCEDLRQELWEQGFLRSEIDERVDARRREMREEILGRREVRREEEEARREEEERHREEEERRREEEGRPHHDGRPHHGDPVAALPEGVRHLLHMKFLRLLLDGNEPEAAEVHVREIAGRLASMPEREAIEESWGLWEWAIRDFDRGQARAFRERHGEDARHFLMLLRGIRRAKEQVAERGEYDPSHPLETIRRVQEQVEANIRNFRENRDEEGGGEPHDGEGGPRREAMHRLREFLIECGFAEHDLHAFRGMPPERIFEKVRGRVQHCVEEEINAEEIEGPEARREAFEGRVREKMHRFEALYREAFGGEDGPGHGEEHPGEEHHAGEGGEEEHRGEPPCVNDLVDGEHPGCERFHHQMNERLREMHGRGLSPDEMRAEVERRFEGHLREGCDKPRCREFQEGREPMPQGDARRIVLREFGHCASARNGILATVNQAYRRGEIETRRDFHQILHRAWHEHKEGCRVCREHD